MHLTCPVASKGMLFFGVKIIIHAAQSLKPCEPLEVLAYAMSVQIASCFLAIEFCTRTITASQDFWEKLCKLRY